jgi:hypothetical protein
LEDKKSTIKKEVNSEQEINIKGSEENSEEVEIIEIENVDIVDELTNVDKKIKHSKKRIIITSLIFIVFLFLIVSISMVGYLQLSTFDISYSDKTISAFINDASIKDVFNKKEKTIEIEVPENIINTEIRKKFNNSPKHLKIEDIYLNTSESKVYINSKLYGLSVPISCVIDYEVKDGSIIINIKDVAFGTKNVKLIKTLENYFVDKILEQKSMVLTPKKLNIPPLLTIRSIYFNKNNMKMVLKIEEEIVLKEVQRINKTANTDLISLYKVSNSETKKEAVNIISNISNFSIDTIELLVKDVLDDMKLVEDMLVLSNDTTINIFISKYGKYMSNLDIDNIHSKKNKLINIALTEHYNKIIKSINNYYKSVLNEPLYINKGKPYSCNTNSYVTIGTIINYYNIEISKEILEKLDFCYDYKKEELLLIYKGNTNKYTLVKGEVKEVITPTSYKKMYQINTSQTAKLVSDINKWEEIEKSLIEYFGNEQIYVRHMKADNKYAFVVSSPSDDYQNYWSMALKKNDNNIWEILDSDVQNIKELNETYKDFNLETVTSEIEDTNIFFLSEATKDLILDELVVKGMLDNKEDNRIVYCSYDGNYIAIKFANNKEYIYKVYKMYLDTVYEKKEALEQWDNISTIITLQNRPTK